MSTNGTSAVRAAPNLAPQQMTASQKLVSMNEQTWLQLGALAELMLDHDRAMNAYEATLRHNPYSVSALTQIASLCRSREQFPKAVEYFQRILNIEGNHGDIWGALGHCYLMMDDLQKAYTAYQQALYHLPNPKEPKLWYGIGILYDRYQSLEHAEEAFSAVLRMDPKFEKANEIYFRLGIIYKQQQKFDLSLQCFQYILRTPPRPLTEVDIWFQIGHVYEQQKEFQLAKEAYERVLSENPNHAKVLQQLGWLFHQQNAPFCNQDAAISYLTKSIEADGADAQSWYLLGRCYMAQQKYNKAYEAYQQAVYRDGRNPTFWCSIGVLYYQIHQYRDALDAYSRAIRLNPYISEVWYDLGTLYESCNNQINDAIDAYQRAAELDPNNPHIKQRLQLLRNAQTAGPQPAAPVPQDVNLSTYQNNSNFPSQLQQGGGLQGPPQGFPGYPHGPPGDRPAPPPELNNHGRRTPPPQEHPSMNRGEHPGPRGPYGMNDARPSYPPHMSPNAPMPRPVTDSPHHNMDHRMQQPPDQEKHQPMPVEKREADDAIRLNNGISNYHNHDSPVHSDPYSRPSEANTGDRRPPNMPSPINPNRPKPETYSPNAQGFKYEPFDHSGRNTPSGVKESRQSNVENQNEEGKNESRNVEEKPGAPQDKPHEASESKSYGGNKQLDEDYDGADALMSMMSMRGGKENSVSREPENADSSEPKRSHTMPPLPASEEPSKPTSVSPHLPHSQNNNGTRAGSVPIENTGADRSTQSSPQLSTQNQSPLPSKKPPQEEN
ncbi:TPR-like protein [Basidiobolus meristosporus CBS 931.73]|uniref:TPR-like protein n=1 Tax=Basidiobolus meristosporus CBS 931.73 TaxID=1314790 RepID=A0A1Y1XVC8_9FUNG|nr:TPR-like protein [Basidiobolus meristosporus CBS 931.73]|eukprot:ORX89446.1 TPR-like protein [Basidiobolus meristosporus CBS 931.73]